MTASYLSLHQRGLLQERKEVAFARLTSCTLCPHQCGVNRLEDETAHCGTGRRARLASYAPHFGEEQPLVGQNGSGTIFFSGCNLNCCFCQNYDISHHSDSGVEVDEQHLTAIMLELQQQGCHNINLVTPTHVVPQILAALIHAADKGLTLPVVYNSSGYDSKDSPELLSGVVDIYMPDFKFWSHESSSRYAGARDYPEVARKAVQVMHQQVGDLKCDREGVAISGLLIRHLLMPGLMDETREILQLIAGSISQNSYVNIMDQYRPCGEARTFPELDRGISHDELQEALKFAQSLGLSRIDKLDISKFLKRLQSLL